MVANKRKMDECKEYVGMIFSTLPKSVKDLSTIETYLIANGRYLEGEHMYTLIYGKMNGNIFTPHQKEDCYIRMEKCDDVINKINRGEVTIEQKFESRCFSTIRLSKREIRSLMNNILLME